MAGGSGRSSVVEHRLPKPSAVGSIPIARSSLAPARGEAMEYRKIEVAPVAGALGAEIGGVDLSAPLADDCFAEIRRAFLEHRVIFFRGQDLSPSGQRDFAARFGPCNRYPFVAGLEECPEVIPIIKEPEETFNFGGLWHSDTTYLEKPPLGTLLYAVETPPQGGDTLFANTKLAYDALSDGMKAALAGLRGLSSAKIRYADGGRSGQFAKFKGAMAATGLDKEEVLEAWHPVVRTHPDTGEKALYLNRAHTVRFEGWTEAESRPWIDWLCEHIARPEFTCRFRWEPGSVALWDNRCTHHFALNDYHGHRRHMHRCTIEGDRPS